MWLSISGRCPLFYQNYPFSSPPRFSFVQLRHGQILSSLRGKRKERDELREDTSLLSTCVGGKEMLGSYRARIIEWHVNVLCRFERGGTATGFGINVGRTNVSRFFYWIIVPPGTTKRPNPPPDVCSPMCVYVRVYKLAELPCLRTSCINRTLSRGTVSSGPPPLAPDCKRRRAEECVCVCLMMSKKFTSSWAVGYVYVLCPWFKWYR